MSELVIEEFERNPFFVKAVRVTNENMGLAAAWCDGEVRSQAIPGNKTRPYVKIRVLRPLNEEQTKVFTGDWIVYAGNGYKKYSDHAFRKTFTKVNSAPDLGYVAPQAGGLAEGDPLVPLSQLQDEAIQEEVDMATEHLTTDEAQAELPFPSDIQQQGEVIDGNG